MELWGWREFFAEQLSTVSTAAIPAEKIARVLKEQRDHCVLINGLGKTIGGVFPGKWRKRRDDFENPSVGDWVILGQETRTQGDLVFFMIEHRLNRFSQILRKAAGLADKSQLLAANVDVAFLVSSCNQDFDVKRLERYLTLLREGVITPVLVLNKCDLPGSIECQEQLVARFPELPLLLTRSDQPTSMNALNTYLQTGQTAVFLGSSGVGKSTLTNHLLGENKQTIRDIRTQDSKGRHTTTGRSMYLLANQQGLIIDTPGLREIQLPNQELNLEEAFPEIFAHSLQCRFPDCRHQSEPGCAVKNAVKAGAIAQGRLEHFQKLKAEIDKKVPWRKK
jgi:ribosome biogenesis GTPase